MKIQEIQFHSGVVIEPQPDNSPTRFVTGYKVSEAREPLEAWILDGLLQWSVGDCRASTPLSNVRFILEVAEPTLAEELYLPPVKVDTPADAQKQEAPKPVKKRRTRRKPKKAQSGAGPEST